MEKMIVVDKENRKNNDSKSSIILLVLSVSTKTNESCHLKLFFNFTCFLHNSWKSRKTRHRY